MVYISVHFGTIELGGHIIAKHLRHLSNKARILETTKELNLLLNLSMGFLNKLFGKGTEETDWVQLESEDAVEEVFGRLDPYSTYFKAFTELCSQLFCQTKLGQCSPEEWPEMDRSMVEVVRFRPISQYIAQKTSVRHESPQVLVIANGEVIFHASHSEVNKVNIQQAYKKALALL